MENNLIPYVEFVGPPGSGKSYFSHKVAEMLRAEGYKIEEPSWVLDHEYGKWSRVIMKTAMGLLYRITHLNKAKRIVDIVKRCGLPGKYESSIIRNILYKAYLINKRKRKVLFFDEGIAQMAVSMAVNSDMSSRQVYDAIAGTLTLNTNCVLIRIDCDTDTALLNMDQRSSHDSLVEKLYSVDAKKVYLAKYHRECETIDANNQMAIPFSFDEEGVIAQIVKIIKERIWNEI